MKADSILPSVADYVLTHMKSHPHRPALVSEQESISYQELGDHVQHVAGELLKLGIERGDVVGVITTPRVDSYILALSLNAIGAIWLGINPAYKYAEMDYIVGDSKPVALFFLSGFEGRSYVDSVWRLTESAPSIRHLYSLDQPVENAGFFQSILNPPSSGTLSLAPALSKRSEDDIAAIVYTSGSSGHPKGCLLPNRAMVRRALIQIEEYPLKDYPRLYVSLPMNHVGGLQLICTFGMVSGGTLNFRERFSAEVVGDFVEKCQINFLALVSTQYQMIVSNPAFNPLQYKCVEVFFFGGARLSKDVILKLKSLGSGRVHTNFGMSETCSSVTCTDPDLDADTLSNTIGRSLRGEVRIINPDGEECRVGEVGELQVKRDNCMTGYLNRPDDTEKVFTSDGWLKTSDKVELLADGNIKYIGRNSDAYKSGGYNIDPLEVEACLEEHSNVKTACVLGISNEIYGKVGHAIVIAEQGKIVGLEQLREWCKSRISNYKVPKTFEIRDSLPLLPTKKVDKKTLREEFNL